MQSDIVWKSLSIRVGCISRSRYVGQLNQMPTTFCRGFVQFLQHVETFSAERRCKDRLKESIELSGVFETVLWEAVSPESS